VNFSDHFVHNYPFQIQENILTVSFQYLQTALPQSINEILIPPPRA
jgi:hypothetical protein